MTNNQSNLLAALVVGVGMMLAHASFAQTPSVTSSPSQSPSPSAASTKLFAIEIKPGTSWDAAKPAHEQAFFREHSANLKKLRDQGSLVFGARYSDKGLVVLEATSADEAHAMMKQDPSVQAKVFAYELHDFNVFYGGTVQPKARKP